jgi:hypothetical protein
MEQRVLKVGDLVTSNLSHIRPEYIIGIVVEESGTNGFTTVLWRDGKERYHLRSVLKWLA